MKKTMKPMITAINRTTPRSPDSKNILIIIAMKKTVPIDERFSSIYGLKLDSEIFDLTHIKMQPRIPTKENKNNGSVNILVL